MITGSWVFALKIDKSTLTSYGSLLDHTCLYICCAYPNHLQRQTSLVRQFPQRLSLSLRARPITKQGWRGGQHKAPEKVIQRTKYAASWFRCMCIDIYIYISYIYISYIYHIYIIYIYVSYILYIYHMIHIYIYISYVNSKIKWLPGNPGLLLRALPEIMFPLQTAISWEKRVASCWLYPQYNPNVCIHLYTLLYIYGREWNITSLKANKIEKIDYRSTARRCVLPGRFKWRLNMFEHAQTPAQGQCFEISQTTNPKTPNPKTPNPKT